VQEADLWRTAEVIRDESENRPSFSNARILLVDDNADMREYLTQILSKHVQVEAVGDGAAALLAAQTRIPNLIVSDVMMPRLDGFQLLRALRADPRTREVPIMLLSARAGEEAIVEGLEAGADDYLIKPFSAQELISRVMAHLQMAQQRGEALQQERNMNRQKDEFISVVSHELNTPLVSILGWTRLLRSHPPTSAMLSKGLATIERNATLQGKLVQDLLDLSRITAGKLRLNLHPVELKPVVETAIATVTQPAADKGIHLTWQENVTEPVVVMADSDRLQQVLCNLLINAIKFTPESGRVTLEWSVKESVRNYEAKGEDSLPYAQIVITDTGIGITADFLPHVFDRFRQAEDANAAKGLGLGLAIARHIVELHNGTIQAESAGAGLGSTFIVRLPLLEAKPASEILRR
jgi:signal transduction histidine kinase